MRKISLIFMLFISLFSFSLKEVKSIDYYAKSYIVLEKNTNKILEGNNYYQTQSVASISKLMTFYVAYKYADLDNIVIVGEEIKTIVGSSVYLVENECITLYELLVALLLRSGNDAAVVIAKYVGTTIPKFVRLMNREAKELGMNNTVFNNPHGLDEFDEGNISCAFDMAILMSTLIDINLFLEIESLSKYKSTNHGLWYNKNKLMKQAKNVIACKTGFTRKARRTLVSAAKKDNLELVVCTLDCSSDFAYHKSLYDNYYENYCSKVLLKKGELYIDKYVFDNKEDIVYSLKKDEWNEYKLFYSLDTYNLKVDIYLISENNEIYLKTLKSNEIRIKEDNFFQKIINIFND